MPDRQKCTRSKTSVFPSFFPYPWAERNSVDYVYFNKKSAVSCGFFAIFRDLPALIYVFIYKPQRHGAQVENLCAFLFYERGTAASGQNKFHKRRNFSVPADRKSCTGACKQTQKEKAEIMQEVDMEQCYKECR